MLQNGKIIEQLTIEEKITIVSDLSAVHGIIEEHSFPAVGFARLGDKMGAKENIFPSYPAMAYTWNTPLAERSFAHQTKDAKGAGITALFARNAGVKCTPRSKGVSEDPYICSTLMDAFAKGSASQSGVACVGCGFDGIDVKSMEKNATERAFHEYYSLPFTSTEAIAYSFPFKKLRGEYAKINVKKLREVVNKAAKEKKGFLLCEGCPADKAVELLSEGIILVKAESHEIEHAVHRFLSSQEKVEHGEMDSASLDDAIESHVAFSIQQLDQAVDRVLRLFVAGGNKKSVGGTQGEKEDALAAALQSAVLLKNADRTLPLKKSKSVLLVGAEEKKDFLKKMQRAWESVSNREKATVKYGFSEKDDRSDDLARKAVSASRSSDVTLVFLGVPKAQENKFYRLPASQLALLDKLHKEKRTVIAVLVGEQPVDVSFDKLVNALLFCPSASAYTPSAVANLLMGKISPSGRLVNTLYRETEDYFKTQAERNRIEGTKIGTFIGYRHYDSNQIQQRYPFGFGLSYTKFHYKKIKISNNVAWVKVKNIGKKKASETVQLYVGKKDSALISPTKQLKAFGKVTLKRGRSKWVKLEVKSQSLAQFNGEKMAVEKGDYEVYAGSSVSAVHLKGKMHFNGETFKKTEEKVTDYLQSKTNLISGGYTMAEVKQKTTVGKGARGFGVFLMGLGVAAALIAVLLQMAGILSEEIRNYVLYGGAGSLVLGFLIWIIGTGRRNSARKKEPVLSTGTAHHNQPMQERVNYRSLFEALYVEEKEEEVEEAPEKTKKQVKINNDEFIGAFNPKLQFTELCAELARFINERGILADKAMARKILAAFFASRVVLIKSNDLGMSERLVEILGEYFQGGVYAQNAAGTNALIDLLFDESNKETMTMRAIRKCGDNRDAIVLSKLLFDDIDDMAKTFTQMTRLADCRLKANLAVYQGERTQKIEFYPNLWFVLCADGNQNIASKNAAFNDAVATLYLQLDECEKKDELTDHQLLNFYQLMKMEQTMLRFDGHYAKIHLPNEDKFWKKLDKIERYLENETGYTFNSKINGGIERFATVFLSCEGEPDQMLDNVVAGKIALTAIGQTGEDVLADGGLMAHVDAIFGDDPADETKRLINACAMTGVESVGIVEEIPVEAAPAEEVTETAAEAPVEEAPVAEETPAAEAPVEEAPKEEKAEETPVEETKEVAEETKAEADEK